MITTAILAAAEQAVNRTLELDPKVLLRLESIAGKIIAIEFEGIGERIFIRPHAKGLDLMGDYDGAVDTTLRGTPMALLRMSNGKPGEGLFGDGVTITGDIELGQRLQRIFGALDIDWEEHLSHLTGDIVAHQLGEGFRALKRWSKHNNQSCERDISEYLRYETESLPLDWEVKRFMDGVDLMRSDIDRLEARINRLIQS
ncbi:MAG: SCP2 sterol-binding domain-containing protein [Gammaproteobacteria bacterium]|nr:SCP2 sterol-binding domain-containing protein [Gammaproteobacteria bacterium]